MLSIRQKYAGGVWQCRGTVAVGRETRIVQEHSTGLRERAAAATYARRLQTRLENEILYGGPGQPPVVTFAEIGQHYIDRPEGLHPNDIWRIGELNAVIGNDLSADLVAAFARFKKERCDGLAPATVNRFRDTLQAAINYGAGELGYAPVRIARVRFANERIRWLTIAHADALTGCYAPHVRPIVRVFRYQGARTQEALQLRWPNVDLARGAIYFERTKTTQPRTVAMHPLVRADIEALLERREALRRAGRLPDHDRVFVNRLGRPYSDTRDYKLPGGNPLKKAHATALARVRAIDGLQFSPNGGEDFTLHDWRHHWASWSVMEGVDLPTLQRLGGWKSLRMVERYAAVSTDHMDAAVARLR